MGDFLVYFCGVFDEAGDFFSDQLPVALAQAAEGYFGGVVSDTKGCGVFQRGTFAFADVKQAALQDFEAVYLPGVLAFHLEVGEGIGEDAARPLALVGLGGVVMVVEFVVGVLQRQGHQIGTATLLPGLISVIAGEEVLQRGEQPVAEAALRGMEVRGQGFFQEVLEEALGEILRVLMAGPAATSEGEQGLPVGLTECAEGLLTRPRLCIARLIDQGPLGGGKGGTHSRRLRIEQERHN